MRWPFSRDTVTRREYLQTREELAEVRRQRNLARLHLDEVLGAMGVFGTDATEDDPWRVGMAQRHLDEVLTRAVQWRETDPDGGEAGPGYVGRVSQATAAILFIRTDDESETP